MGFLFAQLERLWNSLYTAIGTDHGLFHSLNIYNANLNFGLFGAQNVPEIWPSRAYLLHTYKSSPNELINQVLGESSGNFSRNFTKTYLLTYLGPKGTQRGPNIWPTGTILHIHLKVPIICMYTPESTHNMSVNQVSSSHMKNFLREWTKTSKIPILSLIFLIKDSYYLFVSCQLTHPFIWYDQ